MENPKCPKCGSTSLAVERQPNGMAHCSSCNWMGSYSLCFNNNLDSAYLKLQEELAEARRVIEYYGDTSLGETGAWAFEKKFVFGRVQNEDMELLTEPLGAKGERYAIGGKKAREFLTKYPKKEG